MVTFLELITTRHSECVQNVTSLPGKFQQTLPACWNRASLLTRAHHLNTARSIHCPNGKIIGHSMLIVRVVHGSDKKKQEEKKPCTAEEYFSATQKKMTTF